MEKNVRCTKLCVDCVKNINVYENGGADYYGFDFYVEKKQVSEITSFITTMLNELEIPLERIYQLGDVDLNESNVWTKERITRVIMANAELLKHEANCSRSFRG